MSLLRGELPFGDIPKTDGSMPEQLKGIEMAYHIPFTWGVLQLSEVAHADSGLIPLVQIEEGLAPSLKIDRKGIIPQVRVSVIDLSQFIGRIIPETPPGAVPIAASGVVKQGLIELLIGVGKKEPLVEGVVSGAKDVFSREQPWPIEEHELPKGPDGQPFREYVANDLPQKYAHILAHTAGEAVADMKSSQILMETSNSHVRDNRKVARYALLLSSGLVMPNLLLGRNIGAPAGIALLEFGLTSYLINKSDAFFIRDTDNRHASARTTADYFGNVVMSSIHEAYCADVFEERMQGNDGIIFY